MNSPWRIEKALAYLLLIALVLSVHFVARTAIGMHNVSDPVLSKPCYVGIIGLAKWPGIYAFKNPPSLQELVNKAGGLEHKFSSDLPLINNQSLCSNTISIAMSEGGKLKAQVQKMDPYKRIALGLRLDVNTESEQELTAIPGIGIKTARAIVHFRERAGCINSLSQLTSIPGVGPKILRRISPYATITNSHEHRGQGK